jgi:hypothetical protein
MCDEHHAVPYVGQNKELVEEAHLENRIVLTNGDIS